jgi:hypothetical protein
VSDTFVHKVLNTLQQFVMLLSHKRFSFCLCDTVETLPALFILHVQRTVAQIARSGAGNRKQLDVL